MTRPHLSVVAAIAGITCLALVAAKNHKADVPLADVPQVVVRAAEKAVGGFTLADAKMRTKKSGVLFKLEGTAGASNYEIKVDAAGTVLNVEREDGAAKARRLSKDSMKARAASPAGPIGETFPGSPAVRVGYIRHAPIRESSGVAASRTQPGVFWTHNDKGNSPVIYAISREGTLLGEFHISATHDDWEDIAADGEGNLYVGNIGNNHAQREWLEVHRLREPQPPHGAVGAPAPSLSLKVDRTWRLRFPGAPFDCESLFVHDGRGYVISKQWDGSPAGLYRFPLDTEGEVTLERVAELPTGAPVTAADLSPDGGNLTVLTYGELYTFPVAGDLSAAGRVEPHRVATPAGKLEGVCVAADGFVATAESRDIYFFPRP